MNPESPYSKIKIKREEIDLIEKIYKYTTINDHMEYKYLFDVMKSIPSHKDFGLLREDMKVHDCHMHIQKHFIDSYFIGYNVSDKIDLNKVQKYIDNAMNDLDKNKENNERKLLNAKLNSYASKKHD